MACSTRAMPLLLLLVLGAMAPAAAGMTHAGGRISPELDPVSDKKFFKKDYPDDLRPAVTDHFSHPFPTVQDSGDFDRDYVKDENDDKGEWQAQEKYDRLRMTLAKEKDDLHDAIVKEQREEADFEEVTAREKEAEAASKEAEAATEDAEDTFESADEKAAKVKGDVQDGTGHVEKEIKDLADCEKQLKEAKEKLEALLAKEKSATRGSEGANETAAEAEAASEEAEAEAAAAEKEEQSAEQAVAVEEKEEEEALKSYKEEAAEADKVEKDLEAAAKRLRAHRANVDNGADHNGGVYQSAAASPAAALFPALLAVLATQACYW